MGGNWTLGESKLAMVCGGDDGETMNEAGRTGRVLATVEGDCTRFSSQGARSERAEGKGETVHEIELDLGVESIKVKGGICKDEAPSVCSATQTCETSNKGAHPFSYEDREATLEVGLRARASSREAAAGSSNSSVSCTGLSKSNPEIVTATAQGDVGTAGKSEATWSEMELGQRDRSDCATEIVLDAETSKETAAAGGDIEILNQASPASELGRDGGCGGGCTGGSGKLALGLMSEEGSKDSNNGEGTTVNFANLLPDCFNNDMHTPCDSTGGEAANKEAACNKFASKFGSEARAIEEALAGGKASGPDRLCSEVEVEGEGSSGCSWVPESSAQENSAKENAELSLSPSQ